MLAKDDEGLLVKRMGEVVDGWYQKYTVEGGAFARTHFFGADPRLLKMVETYSDEQIHKMLRGATIREKSMPLTRLRLITRAADRDPGQNH